MTSLLVFVIALICVLAALAASSIRILREYERAVVFRLGRLIGQRGPGLVLLIPAIDRMVRVDLRTIVLDIPPQDLITRDNVPAKVNAVTYFRVVDAPSAVIAVERYHTATSEMAQTTLRSVLGRADLDMLLSERERLNDALQQIIDDQTDPWGVKVTAVEIKDVEIPGSMQRAMARQAEAERERRAKVIHAEGEFQASRRLRDAAEVISPNPAALQLRYLQTLTDVGSGQNSTIVFPLPLDLLRPFLDGNTPQAVSDQPQRSDVHTPSDLEAGEGRRELPDAEIRDPADAETREPEVGNVEVSARRP
jgi:regulator of protease activity HflC (stomatin/prohibitin superfamily)